MIYGGAVTSLNADGGHRVLGLSEGSEITASALRDNAGRSVRCRRRPQRIGEARRVRRRRRSNLRATSTNVSRGAPRFTDQLARCDCTRASSPASHSIRCVGTPAQRGEQLCTGAFAFRIRLTLSESARVERGVTATRRPKEPFRVATSGYMLRISSQRGGSPAKVSSPRVGAPTKRAHSTPVVSTATRPNATMNK
jgi:hypothetical protein